MLNTLGQLRVDGRDQTRIVGVDIRRKTGYDFTLVYAMVNVEGAESLTGFNARQNI